MENTENVEYAGFWMRFVAVIIDMVVINLIQYILIVPLLGAIGLGFLIPASSMDTFDPDLMSSGDAMAIVAAMMAVMIPVIILATVIVVLYYAIMEASKYQATLGKMALGLIVTDMEGNRIDFMKSLIRQISKILSSMFFYIGYIMAGFTAKKQALHDMIAGALVVKK